MDKNSTEITKEDEMNILHELNQKNNIKQNKFPMIIPTMTKIIKRKKNNNSRGDSKLKKNQLLIDYNKTSLNINNFRRNLPKIMTSYTPIEKRHKYSNNSKNKNNKENKTYNLSRNFDISLLNNCNSDNNNFFGNNNNYENNENFLTQNNINSLNKNPKIKFDMNKKNLMNKMKHPSKINFNLNKKNFKYKIPIDMINNFNQKRKQKYNNDITNNESPNNTRKLNIRQKNNNKYTNLNSTLNKKKELNIESTLMTFNNLVSQAKELGHILIDNKNLLKNQNQNYDFIENEDNNNDFFGTNNMDMKSEINKLNQEIKKEYKGVEELQKINSELNNKIILFNDNAKQYEKKVDELISVITQVKNNNNNNSSNNSDNISNGISNNNNTEMLKKNNNSNFTIEKVPKKKKMKFGFVELIFMKENKFEMRQKALPPKYEKSENKNFLIKKQEPKLVFVNMNKNWNNGDNIIKLKASNEDYLDAASQMANQIIIESLISLNNE